MKTDNEEELIDEVVCYVSLNANDRINPKFRKKAEIVISKVRQHDSKQRSDLQFVDDVTKFRLDNDSKPPTDKGFMSEDNVAGSLDALNKHKPTDNGVSSERDEYMEIIKAVAHIGIDFGYGKYELEQVHIDNARKLYEASLEEK